MGARGAKRWMARLEGDVVVRVAAYYVALGVVAAVAWRLAPATVRGGATSARAASVAMISAVVIAIPVAWVYTLARQKKGYRQAVVQTLIVLPPAVAGVVVLVKNSLALAFALAGIVAAVRFRTDLEDSKDAVYIFLATGLGLAAAVDLSVALVLSVVFNAVSLALWYTDFGRSPANLAGRMAQRRLERALALANRTGEFVSRVDHEVLEAMSPEQLQALADRALRRQRQQAADGATGDEPLRAQVVLRVRTAPGSRPDVERVLEGHTKRWMPRSVGRQTDGIEIAEYTVHLKRSVDASALLAALRSECAARLLAADVDGQPRGDVTDGRS